MSLRSHASAPASAPTVRPASNPFFADLVKAGVDWHPSATATAAADAAAPSLLRPEARRPATPFTYDDVGEIVTALPNDEILVRNDKTDQKFFVPTTPLKALSSKLLTNEQYKILGIPKKSIRADEAHLGFWSRSPQIPGYEVWTRIFFVGSPGVLPTLLEPKFQVFARPLPPDASA
tara:strand:- start:932 stop:1462 length:531 start_codon:yes stop_codon:yes gene_type:complete